MRNATALFKADWLRAAFIHFRVDAAALQPLVPIPLETFRGDAFVSLVAFTQSRLRPARGGWLTAALAAPLARHEFLNLRTYVRAPGGESGILFLAEWIPNHLAALIGPRTYGLPYRLGRLRYACDSPAGRVRNDVRAPGLEFHCRGSFEAHEGLRLATPYTLADFLVERYVAFTSRLRNLRCFRVAHAPWPLTPLRVDRLELTLPPPFDFILRRGLVAGAHYSPGVHDVSIGRPELISSRVQRRTATPC